MRKYRVLIVEDQAMPRRLFEMYVESSRRYALSASVDSAEMADIYCLRENVDLILMDVITRGPVSGLTAAARIKRQFPRIKIVIVTSMPECAYIDRARAAGVDSFWYKEDDREGILSVMDRTMAGESVYPDAPPALRLGEVTSRDFTARELEVLREMTAGDTNQEIADRLHLSVATVKAHVLSMLAKTGCRNRTELAVRARECGLVILDRRDDTR